MKVEPKGCDGCGEDKRIKLYPTEESVIELCKDCAEYWYAEMLLASFHRTRKKDTI
jgi:ribosome-binding protein aMBF1 (putative translation factor)